MCRLLPPERLLCAVFGPHVSGGHHANQHPVLLAAAELVALPELHLPRAAEHRDVAHPLSGHLPFLRSARFAAGGPTTRSRTAVASSSGLTVCHHSPSCHASRGHHWIQTWNLPSGVGSSTMRIGRSFGRPRGNPITTS